MSQILYLENPEKMTFNTDKEIEILNLNSQEIWRDKTKDTYILNVSSVTVDDFTGIRFAVTIGEGGATVTFNGEEKVLDSSITSVEFLTDTASVTGDVIFKGDLVKVMTGYTDTTPKVKVNRVVQWPKNRTTLYEGQFRHQILDFDIDIPDYFTSIDMLAFSDKVAPDNFGVGKLILGDNIKEIIGLNGYIYYPSFFANGENNGCLWSIGNWVIGTSVVSKNLIEATIPENAEYLANSLFAQTGYDHSAYLETIHFPEKCLIKKIPDYFCKSAPALTSISLPDSIETIGKEAFYGCDVLTNIDLPINLKKINSSAFSNCKALTSVVLPDGLQELGSSAFSSCTSLISITIPESITEISNSLFNGCTGFTELVIPAHINKIGNLAFASVKSLRFMQPAGMAVSLPTAGTNGMCYVKSAASLTIYTDNETIKNYNWSSDNITPTIYHLDGTLWS